MLNLLAVALLQFSSLTTSLVTVPAYNGLATTQTAATIEHGTSGWGDGYLAAVEHGTSGWGDGYLAAAGEHGTSGWGDGYLTA
jgi:hypothetical protein